MDVIYIHCWLYISAGDDATMVGGICWGVYVCMEGVYSYLPMYVCVNAMNYINGSAITGSPPTGHEALSTREWDVAQNTSQLRE